MRHVLDREQVVPRPRPEVFAFFADADRVEYELPFGPLGGLAHRFFVARQLRAIFDYRRRAIAEIFG